MPQSITFPDIHEAVRGILELPANAANLLPLKFYHKGHTVKANANKPFAELIISPNQTQGSISGQFLIGVILINIYVPPNHGTEWPAEQAQKYLDLFPVGMHFVGPGTESQIFEPGTIQSAREDAARNDWCYTPTVIYYDARSCNV